MARKVISVICYVIAGFFLYGMNFIGFFDTPHFFYKLIILGIFSIPALIMLGVGLALRRFRKWQRDIGVVLLSVSGFAAFSIISILCFFLDPEFVEFFPNDKVGFFNFNDYLTGTFCVLTFICVGVLFLLNSKKKA